MICCLKISVMHLSIVNQPLFCIYNTMCLFFCSSVHGFVQTTDLVINEGATQEVITMVLDIKGNTITEPASTRVLNFGFSFTCIYNSNGGGPQAVGELWTWTLKQIGCFNHRVVTLVGRLAMYRHGDCER